MQVFSSPLIRHLFATAVVLASFASSSQGAPITYETYAINDASQWIQFIGTQGTITDTTSGTFSLGQFQFLPLAPNSSINLGSGFDIYLRLSGGAVTDGNEPLIDIKGGLIGTASGTQNSTVQMDITSIQQIFNDPLPFSLSSLQVTAPVLSPSGINGGLTPITGQFSPNAVPEPATWTVVATLFACAYLRRRIRPA